MARRDARARAVSSRASRSLATRNQTRAASGLAPSAWALGLCSLLGPVSGAACAAGDGVWADRVVYGVHNGEAVYEPGTGSPLTYGPFGPANALWREPESVLGAPNTLDYDDLEGFGPVPGGFAGGAMRRAHLAWSVWQWGSDDLDDLGTRPGWLDGRRQNGVSLGPSSQLVVEFDEVIENNPDDGGAVHWGIDLIVHGNAAFTTAGAVPADADLAALTLSGGLIGEPIEIAVAQSVEGPWYTADVPGDALFPTQPWAWRDAAWTGGEQDWGRPVDPSLDLADFAGLTVAQAIALYAGSAGGAGVDLDRLTDEHGHSVSLPWARYVRFRDPAGNGGEICAVADVPGAAGCGLADLVEPFGVLDLADISAFVGAFAGGDALADLVLPFGILDLADIGAFIDAFVGGCP
jgi:hypothetical protein